MALKRKRSNQVIEVENEVLKIRKTYDPELYFSDEYLIIWKLSQYACGQHVVSFVINPEHYPVPFFILQCRLKFDLDSQKYCNVVLELHASLFMRFPCILPENMNISLYLIDANKKIRRTHRTVIETIDEPVLKISFEKFIKNSDLFDEYDTFLSNGEVTLCCKIYHGEAKKEKTGKMLLNDDTPAYGQYSQKVLDNLENLLDSEKFSDMKFIIDSKELKVHKNILSAQSPVFEAMFKHNTQEQRNNSVEIIDISYETMREVLRFIYAGKVDNIKKMVKDIFIAAEKYEIDALKMICENELIESINIKNICDMLKLVDKYDSKNLKKGVFNFISDNAEDINNMKDFDETLNTLSVNLLKQIVKLVMSRK